MLKLPAFLPSSLPCARETPGVFVWREKCRSRLEAQIRFPEGLPAMFQISGFEGEMLDVFVLRGNCCRAERLPIPKSTFL